MLRAEQRTVVTEDGTSLNVHLLTAEHTGPSTPTIVMAHGWTLSSESWLPVVRALADDDVRVVLWDQRGHGSSALGLRRNEIRTASVTQLGRDLHTVISAVVPAESPIVLAGHSMGGMTVLSYAGQFPLELQERVRGVLLVATAAGGLRMGRRRGEKTFMKVLAHGLPVAAGPVITTRSQRALLFGDDADPQDVRATRAQVGATRLPTMGTFYGALSRFDEEQSLAALHGLPVVVLVGARDRLTPAVLSERLAGGIPGSRLTVLPGKGHMLTYEATDEVVAALRELIAA
jgi:pimeloyl-ACP methyl ester carboxylesterase